MLVFLLFGLWLEDGQVPTFWPLPVFSWVPAARWEFMVKLLEIPDWGPSEFGPSSCQSISRQFSWGFGAFPLVES